MISEQDLIKRLMVSKKIMEKHNNIGRGTTQEKPQEQISEENDTEQTVYHAPNNYETELPTKDKILNSKLPDEIKMLMIEHPIEKSTMGTQTGVTLSDDLVKKTIRLMGTSKQTQINETVEPKQNYKSSNSNLDINELKYVMKDIVRETVEEVLKENGLIVESSSKSNEVFKFRVGQHIFEGKVTNIKKISK